MDETWGLSWSRRWHKIDVDRSPTTLINNVLKHTMALCGSALYTQAEVRDSRGLHHLKVVIAEPEKAAGICKKCEKKAAAQ